MAVDQTRLIKAAKKSLLAEHFHQAAEVSILLVNDEEMQAMNSKYRGIDRPTDVLSFSQMDEGSAPFEDSPVILGDIVISVDTAERQAVSRGEPVDDELDMLVVHGILHLLGYDDETDEKSEIMLSRQAVILNGIRNGRRQ